MAMMKQKMRYKMYLGKSGLSEYFWWPFGAEMLQQIYIYIYIHIYLFKKHSGSPLKSREAITWRTIRTAGPLKGKGSLRAEAYRSIFSFYAKIHAKVRCSTLQRCQDLTQPGGRKGCYSDVAHHVLHAHLAYLCIFVFAACVYMCKMHMHILSCIFIFPYTAFSLCSKQQQPSPI